MGPRGGRSPPAERAGARSTPACRFTSLQHSSSLADARKKRGRAASASRLPAAAGVLALWVHVAGGG